MSRTPEPPALQIPARLSGGFPASAWLTVFRVSVAQFIRGRRLLVLALLFCLPAALTLVTRWFNEDYLEELGQVREFVLFLMLPQALVPLTALILASGMIRDEVEGQTLTYLLMRPIPRWSIYLAKVAAAWLVSAGLTAVFTGVATAAVHWGTHDFWGRIMPREALQLAGLSALALLVYTALFGLLGLVVRWVLPLGVAYTVLFEGVFANIDFSVRKLTVLWYVRVLAARRFGLDAAAWSIDLDTAPSEAEALLTLLGAAAVMIATGAIVFSARELRLKTPEGG